MNTYEVRISGQPHTIQVRASKARIALNKALNRLSDSNFLNTSITIRFVGVVPRIYYVKAVQISQNVYGDSVRSLKTLAGDFPTKQAAEAEIDRLRSIASYAAGYVNFHITSTLAGGRL